MTKEELLMKIAEKYVLDNGKKVDHGGGHVVKEIEIFGHRIEVSMSDFGYGRELYIEKALA